MLRSLLRHFDPTFRIARKSASEHIRRVHPTWHVTNARLRVEESGRYVFAVFYADGGPRVVPGRYRIVAVDKSDGTVHELPLSPDSPYWIRGYK